MEIKSISLLSAAKTFFFIGVCASAMQVFINVYSYLHGNSKNICAGCTLSFSFGFPPAAAAAAFFLALVYNVVAARAGGIHVTVEDKE